MKPAKPTSRRTRRRRRAVEQVRAGVAKLPGPSNNPATNLLIADVAMRAVSMLIGRGIEKTALSTRYDPDKAADIVKGRTLVQSMASTGAARMATRSVPGFLLVSGGLLAKALVDRTLSRRESVSKGEKQLSEQAANASDKT
jgi:hypothetical protein